MMTRILLKDLDKYLRAGNLYSLPHNQNEPAGISIHSKWKDKIDAALKADVKHMFKTDMIDAVQKKSIFTIEDPDEQGATIWKSFVELNDGEERLDVIVKFIVSHDIAFIYLGASHTHLDAYSGSNIALRNLFDRLKQKEKIGSFYQTNFYALFADGMLTQSSGKGIIRWLRRWAGIHTI